jgi:hypothetical protein
MTPSQSNCLYFLLVIHDQLELGMQFRNIFHTSENELGLYNLHTEMLSLYTNVITVNT